LFSNIFKVKEREKRKVLTAPMTSTQKLSEWDLIYLLLIKIVLLAVVIKIKQRVTS
jgi:hypothetical protein